MEEGEDQQIGRLFKNDRFGRMGYKNEKLGLSKMGK